MLTRLLALASILAVIGCTQLGPAEVVLTVTADNPAAVIKSAMSDAARSHGLTFESGPVPVADRSEWMARSLGHGVDTMAIKPFSDEPYRLTVYRRLSLRSRSVTTIAYVRSLCDAARSANSSVAIAVDSAKTARLMAEAVAACAPGDG